MTELILVGTDESGTTTIAVYEATDLAANLGAKLLILSAFPHVADTVLGEQAHNVPAPKHWRSTRRAEAQEVLTKAVGSLDQTDVPVKTIAQAGDPADAIREHLRTHGAEIEE